MKALVALIRGMNEVVGSYTRWFGALVIVVVSFDVFMRYVCNSPTIWGYDMSYMLGCCLYTLGLGYLQKHEGNVRVDLLYAKFSARTRLILDMVATLLLFIPAYALLTHRLWVNAIRSLVRGEKAVTSTWYPHFWPVKFVIAIGFSLLVLQLMSDVLEAMTKIRRMHPGREALPAGERDARP